ncbi:MAG TPA: HAD family hydrolase [Silvibacterium sp.]|nr:HAD family hydrolase [Silvibacterium sp.]
MNSQLPQSSASTAAAEPARVFVRPGFRWDEQGAYLFDIDGTLLRSRDRIHFDSFYSSVRSVMGHEIVFDGVTFSGNTDPGILRDAFRLARFEDCQWRPHLSEMLDFMSREVAARRSEMKLVKMPGVDETLAHLKGKGAALGVATGNIETIGWIKIEVVDLRHWFTFGGFSDSYDVRSDMIAHAMREAHRHAGPEATVCVVGDTPFDISAARANGLPTIAVATGHFTFDQLMEHEPEVCATTLEALLQAASPSTSA